MTMPAPPVVPKIRSALPASLQVGEPVVYNLPGLYAGDGDNLHRLAFVVRLYKVGAAPVRAAADLLVLSGAAPFLVIDATYDPQLLTPSAFCRNDGTGTLLLDVTTMMVMQDDSAGGTL